VGTGGFLHFLFGSVDDRQVHRESQLVGTAVGGCLKAELRPVGIGWQLEPAAIAPESGGAKSGCERARHHGGVDDLRRGLSVLADRVAALAVLPGSETERTDIEPRRGSNPERACND
jgi:hypothetical protein